MKPITAPSPDGFEPSCERVPDVIADDAAAVARVHQPDFDPATTAILSTDAGCALGPTPAALGAAEVVSHQATHRTIRATTTAPAPPVLSENA